MTVCFMAIERIRDLAPASSPGLLLLCNGFLLRPWLWWPVVWLIGQVPTEGRSCIFSLHQDRVFISRGACEFW